MGISRIYCESKYYGFLGKSGKYISLSTNGLVYYAINKKLNYINDFIQIAIKYPDKDIIYIFERARYSEKEMLKIIKLQAFV